MNEYEFTLQFAFSDAPQDAEKYVDQLGAAGCDDAIIGIGQKGRIALQFNREAESAIKAISSAIDDVLSVIPDAKLIESSPDFVGVSDLAEILGFSRQNMRKLINSHYQSFPTPAHSGRTSIWHLANVLQWYRTKMKRHVEPTMFDVAQVNMQLNIIRENTNLDKLLSQQNA